MDITNSIFGKSRQRLLGRNSERREGGEEEREREVRKEKKETHMLRVFRTRYV